MEPSPTLMARTPRAGRHNHVDILVPGRRLPPNLDRLVRAAESGQRSGSDYLAVCREVEQGNGRRAREVLILHGIDVQRLEAGNRLAALQEQLVALGDDLERLVTQEINWNENGPAPVEHPRLGDWLERLRQAVGGELPGTTRRATRKRWLLVGALLLLAGAGSAGMYLGSSPEKPADKPAPLTRSAAPEEKSGSSPVRASPPSSRERDKPPRRETPPDPARIKAQLRYLASWWGNSPEADARARRILEAAIANTGGSDLDFAEVLAGVQERYKNSASSRFFLPGLANEDVQALERVSGREAGLLRPADVAAVRKQLRGLAGKIEAAARKAAAIDPEAILISDDPEKLPACQTLRNLIRFLRSPECVGLIPAGSRERAESFLLEAPLFDGLDARIARAHTELRDGFEQLLRATNTSKPEDALLQGRRYLPDRIPSTVKEALRSFCASPELLELVRGL